MEIVLHLGAHKTASTYIQQTLSANAELIASHDIGLVLPKAYRDRAAEMATPRRLFHRGASHAASAFKSFVDEAQAAGQSRLTISEENLLGTLDSVLFGSGFYDRAGASLRKIVNGATDRPVKALISVRSYADYFASAWAQALRNGPYVPFDEGLKTRLMSLEANWAVLVEDIADALPRGSELVIWQYEHLKFVEDQIFRNLVGKAFSERFISLDIRPLAGPSQKAIDTLDEMNAEGTVPDADKIEETMKFLRKSKGFRAFDPWTPAERATLSNRYEKDIALIRQRRPEAFLNSDVADGFAKASQSGVSMYPEPRTV